jgi:hypothetical protein
VSNKKPGEKEPRLAPDVFGSKVVAIYQEKTDE